MSDKYDLKFDFGRRIDEDNIEINIDIGNGFIVGTGRLIAAPESPNDNSVHLDTDLDAEIENKGFESYGLVEALERRQDFVELVPNGQETVIGINR